MIYELKNRYKKYKKCVLGKKFVKVLNIKFF